MFDSKRRYRVSLALDFKLNFHSPHILQINSSQLEWRKNETEAGNKFQS